VIVAGENFGIGSSREQAAQALKHLGISTLIARSFGGIFYRNALNFGMLALTSEDVGHIDTGDRIGVDAKTGILTNYTKNQTLACDTLPPQLLMMVRDGGLVPHLQKKLAQSEKKDAG
jgi:3-isopropylmalate/(R)-2-methylmalate dehydratase small subunit